MKMPLLPPRWSAGPRRSASRSLGVLAAALSMAAAVPQAQQEGLLARYRFSRDSGLQVALPEALREVSGLAVTEDGRLFAHNDEEGVLAQIDPARGTVQKAVFAGSVGVKGDFEGIAVAEGRFYLVTSDGALYEVEEGPDRAGMPYRVHATGLGRYCEVEGLAFDGRSRALLLPCKHARVDRFEGHIVVFSVDLGTMELYGVPRVFLPWSELPRAGLDPEFHPSGIEVDPASGRLLILSGPEETLLELSPEGRLLAGEELPRRNHPQPEGIALLPDGTLVIADEGGNGPGLLTRYLPTSGTEGGEP